MTAGWILAALWVLILTGIALAAVAAHLHHTAGREWAAAQQHRRLMAGLATASTAGTTGRRAAATAVTAGEGRR